ncbi:hypothetical protein [Bacillus sp. 1P06AnD]|uniref:hypothetical protein n=1 Tax=Bacillus sp. 1P06AnD TaxID=3132208 RepID=UPI00399F464D
MKQILAFEHVEECRKYERTIEYLAGMIGSYKHILEEQYALRDSPKGIVWTTDELATEVFSNQWIPAYTNKNVIFITPDLNGWKHLFLSQLEDKPLPDARSFYEQFSENDLLVIVAHELTHHSDLFIDEFDDEREDSIWFEEGMCQYLPRKLLLSERRLEEITAVELSLVHEFQEEYGKRLLDDFGTGSYGDRLSSIMFDYWRSYLAVKYLVEVRADQNVMKVFGEYHKWHHEGRKVPLTEYFGLEEKFFLGSGRPLDIDY